MYRKHFMAGVIAIACVQGALVAPAEAQRATSRTGNVIFLHPDGMGLNHYNAMRAFYYGPDAVSNYDRLRFAAMYRGGMTDRIGGTSNGGATTHAFGYRVEGLGSFGKDGNGNLNPPTDRFIRALSGFPGSLLRQAANSGHPIGVVNDGHIGEPGTGCFLAEVGNRDNWNEISRQIIQGRPGFNDQDPWVIFGGGERNFRPAGATTVHTDYLRGGPNLLTTSQRTDDIDLIQDAINKGYRVIFTRADFEQLKVDLANAANTPSSPNFAPKVLGLFAYHHTMNDTSEANLLARGLTLTFNPAIPSEVLDKRGRFVLFGAHPDPAAVTFNTTPPLSLHDPDSVNPPSAAEMMQVALTILGRRAAQVGKPFMLVAEPESCDNFGNSGNGVGTLAAAKLADDMMGHALSFIASNPNTLVITAADSDAGGLQIQDRGPVNLANPLPTVADNANIDGVRGRNTPTNPSPILVAEPDQFGVRLGFEVRWTEGFGDYGTGAIVTKAAGLNAERLVTEQQFSERFENSDIYRMMYLTLYGQLLPRPTTLAPTR